MKISVIQPDTAWEDKLLNFERIEHILSGIDGNTDIIVLPEMFSTGFSLCPEMLAEPPASYTFDWMLSLAEKFNASICGSYIVKSGNRYFNKWVFITPEGKSWAYDKRHLFRMGNEHLKFSKGERRVIIKFRGFRILPGICYDLRFPVWVRNKNDYDIFINSANWPEARNDVWVTLLKARAIENQCYVAGSNRIGIDGNGIKYSGNSLIINPRGEILSSGGSYEQCAITADISLDELRDFRRNFPVLKDSDRFLLVKD